jgi:hypothetical protein
VGHGAVLRCYKDRIRQDYGNSQQEGHKIICQCGKEIGIDKDQHIKMISKAFVYSGTKRSS